MKSYEPSFSDKNEGSCVTELNQLKMFYTVASKHQIFNRLEPVWCYLKVGDII